MNSSDSNSAAETPKKFGTFGGVFTPNVLTILGVIMFLRTGWVVGNAGLKQALIILVVANVITLLTSLSLSAVATNTKVGGGGAYFLISRSLGLEIGGSIGFPLYLAQAISVTFYIVGFTESLHFLWPDLNTRLVSSAVLIILFIIAWVGANVAIKTQYFIMGALALAIVSFFAGHSPVPDWRANVAPAYQPGADFWIVFAIFFPAVTGIMSGVSMSGDLKDPARSIPRGTLAAVGITFLIYAGEMIWLAMNAGRDELLSNNLVAKRIAFAPTLVYVGLWAATLSSALASLLAAPRTLQALSRDRVLPRLLAHGTGPQKEPRVALVVTALLALAGVLIGDLNVIAPIISMFFLTTYGMLNLVAGLERWVSNPSYRPTFHVHWVFSLVGAGGCLFAMFLLNPWATVVAVLVCSGIYAVLRHRHYQTSWGDVRSGFWFAVTRLGLLRLSAARQHVRNWRPVLLVLVGNPKSRLPLVEFAGEFEARRGLLFMAQIITGDWQKLLPQQADFQQTLTEFIQDNQLSAVAKTILADDMEEGVLTLLQVAGIGSLQPNTVLVGWSEDAFKQKVFGRAILRILQLKRNLIIFGEPDLPPDQLEPRIDIWWRAAENGSFMLTMAHLLQASNRWSEHPIRVLRILDDEAGREQTDAAMKQLLRDARIDAEIEIIVSTEPPQDVMARASRLSEICFFGMALRTAPKEGNPLEDYTALVGALQGNVFVAKSWHDMEL